MLLRRLPRPQLSLPIWPLQRLPSIQRYMGNDNDQPVAKESTKRAKAQLFELLFPEEKLPAQTQGKLKAHGAIAELHEKEIELERGKLDHLLSISHSNPSSTTSATQVEEVPFGDEVHNAVRSYDYEAIRKRQNASVLVLSNASKALAESDFLRLSPRGQHIDSWVAGIIKVIPGRDPQTLDRLGHYFILFSSDAAARAYADQVTRLHDISKRYTYSVIPLPPSYIEDGEDIPALLKAFTLVPASLERPRMTMLKKPFRPPVARLFYDGALPIIAEQQTKSDALVLFALDRGHISVFDLELALGRDGRARNRLWSLWSGGTRRAAIHQLGSTRFGGVEKKEDSKQRVDAEQRRQTKRPPSRFVIAFQDMKEARRFVRAWHRRELPALRDTERNTDDEVPPIVSAELLW